MDQVEYASAAYCSRPQIEAWTCEVCNGNTTGFVTTSYIYNEKTSTNAYCGYNTAARAIVLAFEGSANLSNWIHDLEFFKVDFNFPGAPDGVRVHRGFYTAYEPVSKSVELCISALVDQFPLYSVYITGHSLGGALAVFAALDIALLRPDVPVTLYTYGQPRVGNRDFAQWFDAHIPNSFRTVNNSDIVPSLPPRVLGFWHIATEVWLHDNKTIVCNGSGEDPHCSNSQIDLSVDDHHVYLGLIMSICQRTH